jgi:hypothetical protein
MNAAAADVESTARTVAAQINYLLPGPPVNRRFVSAGIEVNTGRYGPFTVTIRDGRTIDRHFALDTHGFVLANHRSAVEDFYQKEQVDRLYPAEVSEAVKAMTGASFVAIMGWMIRNSGDLSRFKPKDAGPYVHQGGVQPPAGEAHIDTHPDFADQHAKALYERCRPDGPGYRRFIYSSFWRTFSEPPQDCPLAVCDHRSVRDDEGVPNFLHVVDRIPEGDELLAPRSDAGRPAAAIFAYNPNHRWWYFSNMTRDEVLLVKFHDSDRSVAWRTPHTSFWDTSFPDRKVRASIECRSVAYFE